MSVVNLIRAYVEAAITNQSKRTSAKSKKTVMTAARNVSARRLSTMCATQQAAAKIETVIN